MLEYSAPLLAAGIACSMALLPGGFALGASLLLAAPLSVCIAGILARRLGKRS